MIAGQKAPVTHKPYVLLMKDCCRFLTGDRIVTGDDALGLVRRWQTINVSMNKSSVPEGRYSMTNAPTGTPCSWSGTIQKFLSLSRSEWLTALLRHHQASTNLPADERRRFALERSFDILQKEFKQLMQLKPDLGDYTIIFEYQLPGKKGCCPGIIILGASIFILEFKEGSEIILSDLELVDACGHDVKQYHAESHQSDIVPILVLAGAKGLIRRAKEVLILSPDHIADFFNVQAELENKTLIDADRWMSAE
jgi:hypothetical protein